MLKVTSEGYEIDYGSYFASASVAFMPGVFNIVLGRERASTRDFLRRLAGVGPDCKATTNGALTFLTGISGLYPTRTVHQSVAEPLRRTKLRRNARAEQVSECLELFGLLEHAQTRLNDLPDELVLRAELARAWARSKGVIVLDNAVSQLAYHEQFELFALLKSLIQNDPRTLILGTDDAALAMRFADHLMLEADGKIIQAGPAEALQRAPNSLASAQAVADYPLNTATVVKTGSIMRMRSGLSWPVAGRQSFIPEGIYVASLSPYHVLPTEPPGQSAHLRIRVVGTELTHSESRAQFRLEGQPWSSRIRGYFQYTISDMQDFWLDTDKCQYFAQNGRLFVG